MTSYLSLPQYGAAIDERLRLVAGTCRGCAALAYPQRPVCPACGGAAFDPTPLSGAGTIETYTRIRGATVPAEFDDQQAMTGDVYVAIVALAEGPRITVQLTDVVPEAVHIGAPVQATVRRLYDQEGVLRYGLKFAPAG